MNSSQAAETVRGVAASGESARHRADSARVVRQMAPVAAGLALAISTAGRLFHWPSSVGLGAAVLLAAAVVTVTWFSRRSPAVSDAIAARLDADASLGGELRSAHWFAVQDGAGIGPAKNANDEGWRDLHLERAATRLSAVDWAHSYPPPPTRAAWAGAAALFIAAGLLTIRLPGTQFLDVAVKTSDTPAGQELIEVPPEVRKELQEMLARMDVMEMSPEEAKKMKELQDLLARVDASKDPQLAELLKKLKDQAAKMAASKTQPGDPAADPRSATTAKDDEELRQALEDLASRLGGPPEGDPAGRGNRGQSAGERGRNQNGASAQSAKATAADTQLKMIRESSDDPGRGQAMLGGGGFGGDSRGGQGKNPGGREGGAGKLLVPEALRRELVEANADNLGANVLTEDIRRKTEQGTSALGFSRVAPKVNYDHAKATPPPVVPDARRPLVQTYFIRR